MIDALPPKNLASLDDQIVDTDIAVESTMRDALKVHNAQT